MNFLYETPWWLPTGIAALGAILIKAGNNRKEAKVKYAGFGIVGLAILLALVSYFLDSPREIAIKQTKRLVSVMEKRDWPAMQALLHPDISLMGFFKGPVSVVEKTKWAAEKYDLKGLRIAGLSVGSTEPGIVISLQVASEFRDISAMASNWRLEWEKIDTNWMLVRVDSEGGIGFDENQFKKMLGAGE